MRHVKRLAAGVAGAVLVAVFIWTSSQTVRGLVTEIIWDRDSTLECTGGLQGDRMTFEDERIDSAADPLVLAAGSCRIQLKDVSMTAPTAIRAEGRAEVIVEGGRIEGLDTALDVRDKAVVTLRGTEVEGSIDVEPSATVERSSHRETAGAE